MESLSRILKIIAKVFGVCLILWGIVFGVFGIIFGIDLYLPGIEDTFLAILIFIYAIGTGVLYWLPNKKILYYKNVYLVLTLIPIVGLIITSAYEVLIHGVDSPFITEFAIVWVFIMIFLFSTGPVSLILYMKSRQL